MANTYRGEIQDNKGNTVYPHTESEIVFCPDGENVQEKLIKYENALGNVTGTTDSLEVDDSNVLATSKALKKVNDSLGGLRFGTDGEGNYGYFGADDSLIPFRSKVVYLGTGRSFNIATVVGIENVKRYSADNFIVGWDCPSADGGYCNGPSHPYVRKVSDFTLTYDEETGNVTLGGGQFKLYEVSGDQQAVSGLVQPYANGMVWLIK